MVMASLVYLISLIFGLVCVKSEGPLHVPGPSGSRCDEWLKKLKELRLGQRGGQSVVWYYTGVIRNPVSGTEVVGIEGVERCVEVPATFLEGLNTKGKEASENNGETRSFSFLSSKLFAYTDIQNRTKPVTLFRVQPAAPARPVNPLSELNSVITLGYRRRGTSSLQDAGYINGKSSQGGVVQKKRAPFDFFSVVRWPSGRAIHTNKIDIAPAGSNDVMGDSRISARRGIDVIHYINGISASKNISTSTRNLDGEVAMGGQKKTKFNWRKWVTFSGSGSQPWHGKSQEYYTISAGGRRIEGAGAGGGGLLGLKGARPGAAGTKSPLATMHYKRFGEGPEWYATGRPCSTELYAYKYESMQDVPAGARAMLGELCPKFFSGMEAPSGNPDVSSSQRKLRGPAILTRIQAQARHRLILRDAVRSSLLAETNGSAAAALAEADLMDNINKAKCFAPPSDSSAVDSTVMPETKKTWGTPEAFRASVDLRADRRFVPWFHKLPRLPSKNKDKNKNEGG